MIIIDGAEKMQPPSFRPDAIRSKYDINLLSTIPKSRYSLYFEPRGDRSVLQVLHDTLNDYDYDEHSAFLPNDLKPDFLVMGQHGRKGPKQDKTTLGSTTDRALR